MKNLAQRIVLASRPVGAPTLANFRLETFEIPVPGESELLLKTCFLSLDPYMRSRMDAAKSYAKAIEIGEPMEGWGVAQVLDSRLAGFGAGEFVLAHTRWQTHVLSDGKDLRKLEPGIPVTTALGVLGMPGFTAWAGLRQIGKPRAGETLVVAAATGPVGSAVGQIAKRAGARTVGVAGGEKKREILREEFGFDVALDHHDPQFETQLKDACQNGIDIYFENVGGRVFHAVQPLLNDFARVPVCGVVAEYNAAVPPSGPDRLPRFMRDVLVKSITVKGFIYRDFIDLMPRFHQEMTELIRKGEIRYREDIVEGLENAPLALIGLLEGRNLGKLLVKVAS